MAEKAYWRRLNLRKPVHSLAIGVAIAAAGLLSAAIAHADDEASNVAHVAAGPYGRCYAKSVPHHVYDPEEGPRQEGVTRIYQVEATADVLVHVYDWFSRRLFLKCGPLGDVLVARIGPWHRGHDPSSNHLALAFYRGGDLLMRYSTLDIAGNELAVDGGFSKYRNASASVSHYTVFESGPELIKVVSLDGLVFTENWVIQATTIDGRMLTFDLETGEVR
jgi:hypothetical protein